jgi:hypothetical protein
MKDKITIEFKAYKLPTADLIIDFYITLACLGFDYKIPKLKSFSFKFWKKIYIIIY